MPRSRPLYKFEDGHFVTIHAPLLESAFRPGHEAPAEEMYPDSTDDSDQSELKAAIKTLLTAVIEGPGDVTKVATQVVQTCQRILRGLNAAGPVAESYVHSSALLESAAPRRKLYDFTKGTVVDAEPAPTSSGQHYTGLAGVLNSGGYALRPVGGALFDSTKLSESRQAIEAARARVINEYTYERQWEPGQTKDEEPSTELVESEFVRSLQNPPQGQRLTIKQLLEDRPPVSNSKKLMETQRPVCGGRDGTAISSGRSTSLVESQRARAKDSLRKMLGRDIRE